MNPDESFSDAIRVDQRMLAKINEFCARGDERFAWYV